MTRTMMMKVFILFMTGLAVPLAAQADAPSVRIVMGTLSRDIVAPLLKDFAFQQMPLIGNGFEFEGHKKGYKYKASVRLLKVENLFTGDPGETYSVALRPGGLVSIHFHLPGARFIGKIKMKAHQKKPGGLLGGFMAGFTDIDRTYKIKLKGLDAKIAVTLDMTPGQIRIAGSRIESLDFDDIHVSEKNDHDGLGASLFNTLSGGSVDHIVKKNILSQFQNERLASLLTGPAREVARRFVMPTALVAENPPGIEAKTELIDFDTAANLSSQDGGSGDSPGPDEMKVFISMDFVERFATELSHREVFSVSGEQFGIKYQVTPGGEIKARQVLSDHEIEWHVPIVIHYDSPLGQGQMSGAILASVRPRFDPDQHLYLELVRARLESLETGQLPLGDAIRGAAEKILTTRLAEAFPKLPVLRSRIPVGGGVAMELNDVDFRGDSMRISGRLKKDETTRVTGEAGLALKPTEEKAESKNKRKSKWVMTRTLPSTCAWWLKGN